MKAQKPIKLSKKETLAKVKKESAAVQHEEEEKHYWVVTATHTLGPVRQVYPNEKEAERYAANLRLYKRFKNVTVEQGGPR